MKTNGGTLLDLYAGTGTIGILLSDRFDTVYSVELVTEASKDGAKNAQKNGVSNITFINEKTEKFLPKFLEENT
jgi:23S rRNA (uracil1939-C5)-methyltransferase